MCASLSIKRDHRHREWFGRLLRKSHVEVMNQGDRPARRSVKTLLMPSIRCDPPSTWGIDRSQRNMQKRDFMRKSWRVLTSENNTAADMNEPLTPASGDVYLVVDDHVLVREGVARVFGDIRPGALLHEASSFAEAVAILRSTAGAEIDTVLLDLHLPDSTGLDTLHRLQAAVPHLVIGVISGTDDDQLAMQCLQHGASVFVPKHGPIEHFVQGITAMASGGVYFPRELISRVLGRLSPAPLSHDGPIDMPPGVHLTPRQVEVLRLVRKGCANLDISQELGISIATVKLHVRALLRAYKMRGRVQLILAAGNAHAQH
jgi:DNA-binding NarL/FixJ family response regulator